MTAGPPVQPTPIRDRNRRRRPRPRVSVLGVLGELLMTAGVLVLLYLGWQLWWNDAVLAGRQASDAAALSQSFATADPAPSESAEPEPADPGAPVVTAVATEDSVFGNLWVPRYGDGWVRTIAEGTSTRDVLDKGAIGHYVGTQMPGEVGNFAIAAHRKAYGGGMEHINELQLGDAVYVETADGWYTYRFRDLEYVQPSAVEVIDPVPWRPDAVPTDRLITLTTCNPLYSTAERVIAYGVFESWQPRSAGPPAEIAASVAAATEG